jgi:hypothetical protein
METSIAVVLNLAHSGDKSIYSLVKMDEREEGLNKVWFKANLKISAFLKCKIASSNLISSSRVPSIHSSCPEHRNLVSGRSSYVQNTCCRSSNPLRFAISLDWPICSTPSRTSSLIFARNRPGPDRLFVKVQLAD